MTVPTVVLPADTSGSRPEITYDLSEFPPGLVAIPAMDWIWTYCVDAFMTLRNHLPAGCEMVIGRESSSAAYNRNRLAEQFLSNPLFEWCLFLDSDMVPPAATVARLLSHNVEAVGALCFERRPPHMPGFGAFPPEEGPMPASGRIDVPADGLLAVQWVGGASLMVRRSVFEELPYPFFEHPVPGEGEDALFCMKLRTLGILVYVDCGLVVGHVTPISVDATFVQHIQPTPANQALIREQEVFGERSQRFIKCQNRGVQRALARLAEHQLEAE